MKTSLLATFTAAMIAVLAGSTAPPAAANDPQKLIDDSAALAKSLLSDSDWANFHKYFGRAEAVVLAPDFLKVGLFFGGAGGQCVMIARDPDGGDWTAPSFCLMGEASFGLQIGVEKLEIMLMIMKRGALDRIISGTAKLGGEAGMSIGLIGQAVEGGTTLNLDADIIAFARGQGFYGGLIIEGGYIGPDSEYNHAYYGRPVTARNILIDHMVDSPHAQVLREVLEAGVGLQRTSANAAD